MGGAERGGEVLVNVVEEHAFEAAFAWSARDLAASSRAYDLADLSELDDKLECHLEGLRLAKDAGWELCFELLEDEEPGAIFSASLLAVERADWKSFANILDLAVERDGADRELISALGWMEFERLDLVLQGMFAKDAPGALVRFGIAAHAIHRRDAGTRLSAALSHPDASVRARAYRAAGELQRHDVRPELVAGLTDEDEDCRFWSAWAAAAMRDSRGQSTLEELVQRSATHAVAACDVLMRTLDAQPARELLRALASRGDIALRAAIFGAGALGDPAFVPWLVSFLEDEERARPAAAALAEMLGAELTRDLSGPAPKGFVSGPTNDTEDDDVAMDSDGTLEWPDPKRVALWCKANAARFEERTRYAFGKPVDQNRLQTILRDGNQVARRGAALELALLRREPVLFETRAPGHRQLAALAP